MNFTEAMTTLYTSDIDKAFAFYRDRLGGSETFRFPREGQLEHVEFRIGDTVLSLTSRDAVTALGMPEPTRGNPMELVVWTESTDDAVAALRDAGTPVLLEPVDHVAGMRRAYVADPDGNWIAVVSRS